MKSGKSDLVSGAYVDFQIACLKVLPRSFSKDGDRLFWTRNGELLGYAIKNVLKLGGRKKSLLRVMPGRVILPSIDRFVVADNFKLRREIYNIDERFTRSFLKKVEGPADAAEIVTYKAKVAYEAAIILELGERCIMTLGQLFHLIICQGNGEEGFLLNQGEVNTIYTLDCNGTLASVSVYWDSDRTGWHVQGGSHLTCGMLADARQVLSRAA